MVSATIIVITAMLTGFLAGVAVQYAFITAKHAWKDAKEKREARIKPVRWDG